MATIAQVIVDGANGVTQASRLTQVIPWWQWLCAVAILTAGGMARTWTQARGWMLLAAFIAFVPGYLHVFVRRADAPAAQAQLASTVNAVQAAYVARAQTALAAAPAGACYEPIRDASCIPFGGLQDGAAIRLGRSRQCVGGETSRVRMSIRECSLVDLIVEIAP